MIDVKTYDRPAAVMVESEEDLIEVLKFFQEKDFRWRMGQDPLDMVAVKEVLSEFKDGGCIRFVEHLWWMDRHRLSYSSLSYCEGMGIEVFDIEDILPERNVPMEDLSLVV